MFGYRVIFQRKQMQIKVPEPSASQAHKPIAKFVSDVVGDLSSNYH